MSQGTQVQARCHCNAVTITLNRAPSEVFECNCSICRKLGVLWAYYHCDEVTFDHKPDATRVYVWNEKILEFHSCVTCGCTTHWIAVDKNWREKMGVNARLIEGVSPDNTTLEHVAYGDVDWFWTQTQSQ